MKLDFALYFTILYLIECVTSAYIPIQDEALPSKAMQRQEDFAHSVWDENESNLDCIQVLSGSDNNENVEFMGGEDMDNLYAPSNRNIHRSENLHRKDSQSNSNCRFCKRDPMNPWQRVKHQYRKATPATKQKVAIGTGVGLVTLGAIATPVPESPAKRDVNDGEAPHAFDRENINEADLPGILCTYDQDDGQMSKRNQFLQTAGTAVMFGGMVIPPAVASVKTHISNRNKSRASAVPVAKRSLSFNQMEMDEAREYESSDDEFRERGGGMEFLNTASLAGMVGGTVIMPGIAAVKSYQNKRKQGLQKRSPFFKLFKKAVKAIPTAINTGKDIHGIIKSRRKRSLPEDEYAPLLEKRARFRLKMGKALNHLNTAGTVAMVGSTGIAAHGAIKDGWNAKKNAAAAAAAPPPRKRDLEIDIFENGREISIIKREPTRGINGGRARGSRGSRGAQKEAASAARHEAAAPKMGKMDKAMAGAGALMSVAMVASFAGEVKGAVTGPKTQKRDESEKEGALVKRARFNLGKSRSMPARKTAPKPAAKPAGKSGGGGKGIGGKIAGAAGAAMSAASVAQFAGEAKAAVAKPAAPPQRKRASNEEVQFLVKRGKVGGSPRSRTKPYRSPSKPASAGGSGGGKFGKALETAGAVSMVGGMATPLLTPVASAAQSGWSKVKGAITGKKPA
ncbi:uncharacterized protein FA14DRAFT_180526 [Meira miltonrushii]|uniref:Uncharacterized protein n=1 Tax=Meira miltonrushii TaxID=1280837 RepID=A0A316V8H2_9BASI|nr:uncharacterized protein FA14DRAFT_180526 [Meira miltonrushii]PWN33889.1 hypothetical protein FA14DRAFT_180526 [Meira miltonrushii]